MTIDLALIRETTDHVANRRMHLASPDRIAEIKDQTVSAASAILASMTADTRDAVQADASALWRLIDAERASIVRAESAVQRMRSGRAYRSDEIHVATLDIENMDISEKRALVDLLTHCDADTYTEEKLDAVLYAIRGAGTWDALALKPRHDASHVGHLLELVSDASRVSLRENDYADALRSAADVDMVSGSLGVLLRTVADATPAWKECERASDWHTAHALHAMGADAFAMGDHLTAWRIVGALTHYGADDLSDRATDRTTDHAADACAIAPERIARGEYDGTSRVPWSDALRAIGADGDAAAVERARYAARQWGSTVRQVARRTVSDDHAVTPGNGVPYTVAPTGETVRFALRDSAWQARYYAARHAIRVGRAWYAIGADAFGRGDRATAWRILGMIADESAPDIADPTAYAGAHSVPVARGTRDAATRGTTGAHVVRYGASGMVTHVPGDESVLSDKRYA